MINYKDNDACLKKVICITPFEQAYINFRHLKNDSDILYVQDLGSEQNRWTELTNKLLTETNLSIINLRIPERCTKPSAEFIQLLLENKQRIANLILGDTAYIGLFKEHFTIIVQAVSICEVQQAIARGVNGIIAKGSESAGKVGELTSFVLFQNIISYCDENDSPVWIQGGIGFHTAPAAISGGACGVVLDSQLHLLSDISMPFKMQQSMQQIDSSQISVNNNFQTANITIKSNKTEHLEAITNDLLEPAVVPVGQDFILSKLIKNECDTIEQLSFSLHQRINNHIDLAKRQASLAEYSSLASKFGMRFPIFQGPMTRVSDNPEFAQSVSENGAMPILALSTLSPEVAKDLIIKTKKKLQKQPWGIGILGFINDELLNAHMELILEFSPNMVLIAGGRPSQAKQFEEQGITTFLHVPSSGLLELFYSEGARHFVFEGQECGGHIGPYSSFTLWEQQLSVLEKFEDLHEINVLFAGGIHDARSSAMVATAAASIVARGASIGVIMGTAYIATKEAIKSKAVVSKFQQKMFTHSSTATVKTGAGHVTRCLNTPFVEEFNTKKNQLKSEKLDPQQELIELEKFNVGRLRIATKGLIRQGEEIVDVDEQIQDSQGMYMIGQITNMYENSLSMSELHENVSTESQQLLAKIPTQTSSSTNIEQIAIVGIACRFPKANNLDEYWHNIMSGTDCITDAPKDRLDPNIYFDPDSSNGEKTPTIRGGFLDDMPFEPMQYGIPPSSINAISPEQLFALEVAVEALKDADLFSTDEMNHYKERVSVIVGVESGSDLFCQYNFRNLYPSYCGEMDPALDQSLPRLTEDSFAGVLTNVISGRICNRLDFSGANFSVDAACASSLCALDAGINELKLGKSDIVLIGGVDITNGVSGYLSFASVKALSRTEGCRAFDQTADGITISEGVGFIVLRRMTDAKKYSPKIYAVIDAVNRSSDGKSMGLTAPRKNGQKKALLRTYQESKVPFNTIGMIEAHGTGTTLGDRTELSALTEVFNSYGSKVNSIQLGSVKSQIGHTKCASGIAGLIKVAKSLYHKVLPGTYKIKQINSYYQTNYSPFNFNNFSSPWRMFENEANKCIRRAAVSAFGFGGTNYHAVLSEPPNDIASATGSVKWAADIFILYGNSEEQAKQSAVVLIKYIQSNYREIELKDIAYSLMLRKNEGKAWFAFLARDKFELSNKLVNITTEDNETLINKNIYTANSITTKPIKTAFVFPGQGSQYLYMLLDIVTHFPEFHQKLHSSVDYLSKIYPNTSYSTAGRESAKDALTETSICQPAIGIMNHTMQTLLQKVGVNADTYAGHSYGEVCSIAAANQLPVESWIQISELRSKAMVESIDTENAGAMAVIVAEADLVSDIISKYKNLVIANYNSPSQLVISGDKNEIKDCINELKSQNIYGKLIPTAMSFHHPKMQSASELFKGRLSDSCILEGCQNQTNVYSNVTANLYNKSEEHCIETLSKQIVSPVLFKKQIEAMFEQGVNVFIEVGPNQVLTQLMKEILKGKDVEIIPTDNKGGSSLTSALDAIARLAVIQKEIEINALFEGRECKLLNFAAIPNSKKHIHWINTYQKNASNEGTNQDYKLKLSEKAGNNNSHLSSNIPNTISDNDMSNDPILTYFNNMRELVEAQKQVMLAMLGENYPSVENRTNTLDNAVTTKKLIDSDTSEPEVENEPELVSEQITIDTQSIVQSIVSERTGYPIDVLEAQLNLEADLSIDSIKRTEIVGKVLAKLETYSNVSSSALKELEPQLLRSQILQELYDTLKPFDSSASFDPEKKKTQLNSENQEQTDILTKNCFANMQQVTINAKNHIAKEESCSLVGNKILILYFEEEAIRALADNLKLKQSEVITQEFSIPLQIPPEVDTCLIQWGNTTEMNFSQVTSLLLCFQQLIKSSIQRVHLFEQICCFPFDNSEPRCPISSAIFNKSSMLKTLSKEQKVVCQWIGVGTGLSNDDINDFIYKQLIDKHPDDEVYLPTRDCLLDKKYCVKEYIDYKTISELPDVNKIKLNNKSTILVTGGGKGITAECVLFLAETFKCHFFILGRTERTNDKEPEKQLACITENELKHFLISEKKLSIKDAVLECKLILGRRELEKNLQRISDSGATVNYHSTDLTANSFTQILELIYSKHSSIDMCIHAAGIIQDKYIVDKSVESFEQVMHPKVNPAITLCNYIKKKMTYLVCFSSVSGEFGSAGQVDYACANGTFTNLLPFFNQIAHQSIIINWGPWAETGMASKGLQQSFKTQGIAMLPINLGVQSFAQTLMNNKSASIVNIIATEE